jgi:hypothetical protein
VHLYFYFSPVRDRLDLSLSIKETSISRQRSLFSSPPAQYGAKNSTIYKKALCSSLRHETAYLACKMIGDDLSGFAEDVIM